MSLRPDPIEIPDDENLVPVVFARTEAEAERFRDLLADHDIPAALGTDEDVEVEELPGRFEEHLDRGVAVLVPQGLAEEAQEILADIEDDEFALDEDEELEEEDEEEGGDGLIELEETDEEFEEEAEEEEEEDEEEEEEEEDEDLFDEDEDEGPESGEDEI